jgi:glyoxylase-like metal-dependent hydrolase (beta-lactamase superfamily II)
MTLFAGHRPIKWGPTASSAWLAALALAAGLGMAAPAAADDPPEWSTPVKPFNIAGDVYYVGTKGLAAYLIVSSQGAILLDGTTAKNAPLIERNIEQVGVPLHAVKRLVSDHAHPDHVGALAQIKRDTGAEFWASAGDSGTSSFSVALRSPATFWSAITRTLRSHRITAPPSANSRP